MKEADADELIEEARAAEADGRTQKAILLLERVVRHAPLHAGAWAFLADLYAGEEQFAAAQEAFNRAIAAKPDYAAAHSGLGRSLAALGRNKDALPSLETSIRLHPTASRYVLLADVQGSLGADSAAEESLRRALELEPDNEEAMLNLAVLRREQDPQEALTLLKSATKIDPLNSVILRELGFELARTGSLEDAQHHLETARTISPTDAWTHLYLAKVYHANGEDDEAEHEHREAVRLSPLSALFLQQLGSFELEQNRPDDAIRHLREAQGLQPQDAEGAFLLGKALIAAGAASEGKDWLHKALSLDPNHQGARRLRDLANGHKPNN
jgi:tetratricopeptide (TPR) repeat protein